MTKPIISKNFTLDDIRNLRDYNSKRHLKMSTDELIKEGERSMSLFLAEIQNIGDGSVFCDGEKKVI